MAENKSHHYVPRFYLRRFSTTREKRTINLFYLKQNRLIKNASIRHQSCKNYFYGNDPDIEKVFSSHEGDIAKIIESIMKSKQLPDKSTSQYVSLVSFILFQRSRTERAAMNYTNLHNAAFQVYASEDPRLKPYLDKIRLDVQYPALQSIATMYSITFLADDLKCLLVYNQSNLKFLTSDNPVFFDNRYMEKKSTHGGHTGIASKGLRIFFPLSPDYLLVLFDSAIYNIRKFSQLNSDTICVDNVHDIWGLNRLQFAGASNNIYCDSSFAEDELRDYYKRSIKCQGDDVPVLKKYPFVDKPSSSLMAFQIREPKCALDLKFITITRKAMETRLSSSVVHVRNPELCRKFNEFNKLVERGVYKDNQFDVYLRKS